MKILAFDRTCKNKKYEKNNYYEIFRFKSKAPYGKPSLIPKLIIWNIYEFMFLLKNDAQIIHACDFDTLIPAAIITKLKRKKLTKKIQDKNVFDIFYAGVLLKSRGLEHIAKASSNLEGVHLIIAGYGTDEDYFVDIISSYDHIDFLGKIDYEEVLERTLHSDVLFALYDPNVPNNKYSSPNKLFEAMMCGKPIIVSDGTSMANIVRAEDCGLVVPYGDVETIRNAIIRLKEDQHLRESIGQNGRKAYESKYSWDIMEERLINTYYELSNKL